MKTNYGTISKLMETLQRMSGLTGEVGYAIAKTKRMIRPDVDVFRELRDNLVKKYGTETEQGITVHPTDECWPAFLAEYSAIFDKPVEVELYQVDFFDIDALRCETASAEDYDIFEQFMVKRKEVGTDDKHVSGGNDQEDAG